VTLPTTFRIALFLCLLTAAKTITHAQGRGGPPGGGPPPGGGMGGGGMMGGPPRGAMDRMPQPIARIRTEPQLSLPGRWWDDKKTVKSINLRPDQQHRMDDIFNASKGNLISLYENLQREEQRFVSMPREELQDEAKVFAEIDRVAQARSDLEKANFHILLQIRKEMDPDQLAALDRQIANNE